MPTRSPPEAGLAGDEYVNLPPAGRAHHDSSRDRCQPATRPMSMRSAAPLSAGRAAPGAGCRRCGSSATSFGVSRRTVASNSTSAPSPLAPCADRRRLEAVFAPPSSRSPTSIVSSPVEPERLRRLARRATAAAARPSRSGSSGGCARSSRRSPRARRAAPCPSPPSRATSPSRTPCRRARRAARRRRRSAIAAS